MGSIVPHHRRADEELPRIAPADVLPQLLGDEGHEGMEQPQRGVVDIDGAADEDLLHRAGLAAVEPRLEHLKVPVAVVVPEELVHRPRHAVHLKGGEGGVHLACGGVEPGENPAVGEVAVVQVDPAGGRRFAGLVPVHQKKAAGVPDLVREVAADFVFIHRIDDVLPQRRKEEHREPHGVGPVLRNEVERFRGIAEGFRHLPAAIVAHDAGEIHVAKGNVVFRVGAARERGAEPEAGHDHPSHPEEDDLGSRDKRVGRIEGAEILRPAQAPVLGPVVDGEGPEPGGEPGVQHVVILTERAAAAVRAPLGDGSADDRTGTLGRSLVGAVPDGNTVSPPQLPRNAPVADAGHPVLVHFRPALGMEPDVSLLHHTQRGLRQGLHFHKPLVGQVRLDHRVAPVTASHTVGVVRGTGQQSGRLQVLQHQRTCLSAIHVPVALGHGGIGPCGDVKDVDLREVVPLPDPVVVRVVRGSHLHHAGAERRIHEVVRNDRDRPPRERKLHGAPDERCVPFVRRVDGHSGIAQQSFRAGCRDHGEARAVGKGIADGIQLPLLLCVLHLVVTDRRVVLRAPVHNVGAAVDEAVFVQTDEHFADSGRERVVHGEPFAFPVAGGAQRAELADDGSAVLPAPFPDALHKPLAAKVVPRLSLLHERLLHHVLRRDPRVVRAGDPACLKAHHPPVTDKGVLKGVVQNVPHVQHAGDVRRGDDDRVGGAGGIGLRMEQTVLLPSAIPGGLHVGGRIDSGQCG